MDFIKLEKPKSMSNVLKLLISQINNLLSVPPEIKILSI